jgi:hypothetical protein
MQMKRNACILVFLTIWVQFDNALLTLASAFQTPPVQNTDDEYVVSKGQQQQTWFGARRQPQAVNLRPLAADLFFVGKNVSSECNLTTLYSPPPLYVFMSLQI